MKLEERLVVAVDYDPRKVGGKEGVIESVDFLTRALLNLGVYVKGNSWMRASDYNEIDRLHQLGLRVFADLKLNDIPSEMEIDAALLAEYRPEILTVMCSAGVEGMRVVQETLPSTEVLGVTVLTSLDEAECFRINRADSEEAVRNFAHMAQEASLHGLVCSVQELAMLHREKDLSLAFNTPGIRLEGITVVNDDQSRVATPREAIRGGAERVIIGRPITQAKNPRTIIARILDEIQQGLEER